MEEEPHEHEDFQMIHSIEQQGISTSGEGVDAASALVTENVTLVVNEQSELHNVGNMVNTMEEEPHEDEDFEMIRPIEEQGIPTFGEAVDAASALVTENVTLVVNEQSGLHNVSNSVNTIEGELDEHEDFEMIRPTEHQGISTSGEGVDAASTLVTENVTLVVNEQSELHNVGSSVHSMEEEPHGHDHFGMIRPIEQQGISTFDQVVDAASALVTENVTLVVNKQSELHNVDGINTMEEGLHGHEDSELIRPKEQQGISTFGQAVYAASTSVAENVPLVESMEVELPTVEEEQNEAEDLERGPVPRASAVRIAGLYQLVKITSELQNDQVVSKPLNIKSEWERLLSDTLPSTVLHDASARLDFAKLDGIMRMGCTGVCGDIPLIKRYLGDHCGMPENVLEQLETDKVHPGLLLWLPEDPCDLQMGDPGTRMATPQLLRSILILWPVLETFTKPSRQASFCSCLRYALEMCSELVCLMGDENFNHQRYPLDKKKRSPFRDFEVQEQTTAETDVKLGNDAFTKDVSTVKVQGSIAGVALDSRTSGCTLFATSQEAETKKRVNQEWCFKAEGQEGNDAVQELCQNFSVKFELWNQLMKDLRCIDQYSKSKALELVDNQPFVRLLRLAFPAVYEEFMNASKGYLTGLEERCCRVILARDHIIAADQKDMKELKGALLFLTHFWFPTINDASTSNLRAENMPQTTRSLEGQAWVSQLEELEQDIVVDCPICSYKFDAAAGEEHAPFALPCSYGAHVFCSNCVQELSGMSLEGQLKCPTCREYHAPGDVSRCLRTVEAVELRAKINERKRVAQQAVGVRLLAEAAHLQVQMQKASQYDTYYSLNRKYKFSREAIEAQLPAVRQKMAEAIVFFRDHDDLLAEKHRTLGENDFIGIFNGVDDYCALHVPPTKRYVFAAGWLKDIRDVVKKKAADWLKENAISEAEAVAKSAQLLRQQVLLNYKEEKRNTFESRVSGFAATAEREIVQIRQAYIAHVEEIRDELNKIVAAGRLANALPAVITKVRFKKEATTYNEALGRSETVPAQLILSGALVKRFPGVTHHSLLMIMPNNPALPTSIALPEHTKLRVGFEEQILLLQALAGGRVLCVMCTRRPNGGAKTEVFVAKRVSSEPLSRAFVQVQRAVSYASFDEVSRMLVLQSDDEAKIFVFNDTYDSSRSYPPVPQYGLTAAKLLAIPGRKELLALLTDGQMRVHNVVTGIQKPSKPLQLAQPSKCQLLITSDAALVLVVHPSSTGSGWSYDAYSLLDVPLSNLNIFSPVRLNQKLEGTLGALPSEGVSFRICKFGMGDCLVALDQTAKKLLAIHLIVTSFSSQDECKQQLPMNAESQDTLAQAGASQPSNFTANALLDYFFWTFEKFPANNSLNQAPSPTQVFLMMAKKGSSKRQEVEQYIQKLWKAIKEKTKKNFSDVDICFKAEDEWKGPSKAEHRAVGMGSWLLRSMTLVPLQICRCEGNSMHVMSDNELLQLDMDSVDVNEVANHISFGMYDLIFQSCANMPVLVISSMGSQSVGKSYQLNHLGGCFFDVSGGRCTDGCWMSCRVWSGPGLEPRLLVFLDFEGIGSWERTESEDMLLSLFSAAISNLTMFKTHFTFDRYLDQTLKRFNLGAPKVRAMCSSSRQMVFRGKIMFCLKDCHAGDEHVDFEQKLKALVQENKDNFLKSLYNGKFTTANFPALGESDFYQQLDDVVERYLSDPPNSEQQVAVQFVAIMKTLLAKISHKDWTPIDRNQIRSRVEVLATCLAAACALGSCTEYGQGEASPLVDIDLQRPVDDTTPLEFAFSVHGQILVPAASTKIQLVNGQAGSTCPEQAYTKMQVRLYIPDQGIHLLLLDPEVPVSTVATKEVHARLRATFTELFPGQPCTLEEFQAFHSSFNDFIAAVLQRRLNRVKDWLAANMKHFLEDHEAVQLLKQHRLMMDVMVQHLALCSHTCKDCYLPCSLPARHEGEHSCQTDHKCSAECHYCAASEASTSNGCADSPAPSCEEKAGHPGNHNCGSSLHICGMDCALFNKAYNCRQKCTLLPGHTENHICDSRNHMCGEKCSLQCCNQECRIPYGQPHEQHVCAMRGCPKECELCHMRCSSEDHFHDATPGTLHLCGREHPCLEPGTRQPKPCSCEGICEIRSELHRETRTFHGARGDFDYEFRTCQVVKKLSCVIPIPVGKLEHEGACICSTNPDVIHFCGHPCPSCAYLCTNPRGHQGRHQTQHGNMLNCYFISDEQDIDVENRQYVRGEAGTAETCDSFCAAMKRGHVHTLPCDDHACDLHGPSLVDGRRHARVTYLGGGQQPEAVVVDELTHDAYYEAINFEDPCSDAQKLEFRKCSATCGSAAHDANTNGEAPQCELPLWHAPVTEDTLPEGCTGGYISPGGHYFACNHGVGGEYGLYSTYFIVDRSGSMCDDSVKPASTDIRGHRAFSSLVDNVLGTVYEAIVTYIGERRQRSPSDQVTLVAFDGLAETVFKFMPVSTPIPSLVQQMLAVAPRGGTTFSSGLREAHKLLKENRSSATNGKLTSKPIFILLTDSGDTGMNDTDECLREIMRDEGPPAPGSLTIHFLGFGPDVNEGYISRLAAMGRGSHHVCAQASDVGRLELVQAFSLLAEKPDRHAALMPRGHRAV